MKIDIEPQRREIIYNMGYNFALEGLNWDNYKPFYSPSQDELYNLEQNIFMIGFKKGQEILAKTYNDDKVEVTKSK